MNFAVLLLLFVWNVESKLLFDGSASKSEKDVWKIINIEGKSSYVKAVDDPNEGKIWKFHKGKGDLRAEGHGSTNFSPKEGDNIYIGWRLKLEQPLMLRTYANFQWKSYGDKQKQNHPYMLRAIEGNLVLQHTDENSKNTRIWNTPLKVGQWSSVVLRIYISREASKGYVEFWFNGKRQTFADGSKRAYGRTWDADYCDPKWGTYGGQDEQVVTYISAIKIATTYKEAAPTS